MLELTLLVPVAAAAANSGSGKRLAMVILLLAAAGGVVYFTTRPGPTAIILTGIVTTDDVIVSSQISGRIVRLEVREGDTVTANQLVATIAPEELEADRAYYAHSAEGYTSQVSSSEAALRYQEEQTEHEIQQAEASLAAAVAQRAEANANLENARLNFDRASELVEQEVVPREQLDQTRTAYDAAKARVEAAAKQVEAQRAALALARSSAEQIAIRRSQLSGDQQQRAAAEAQRAKADVRLGYTRVEAPLDGIVDVVAARQGEVVNPGQPILTLINPDALWVRADVEETYIEQVRLGEQLTLRLPSGEEREGTVIFRGVDAGFATQRDVSRAKRDIKTFEVRLRTDNSDRRLAVGMTVYVVLPAPAGGGNAR
jgi:multidrug resistance efflux pump